MSIFDLHVHTTHGSSDSSLTAKQLVDAASSVGLDGVCLTEHSANWEDEDLEEAFGDLRFAVYRALEVDTDMGHILVFGMHRYVAGIHRASELRKAVDNAGGVMISAHPFRNLFNKTRYNPNLLFPAEESKGITVDSASNHPLFKLVDDIEVINGSNTPEENRFTNCVAFQLGFKGIGGSDVHSLHGLGSGVTIFDYDIRSEAELVSALKAKRYRAGTRNEIELDENVIRVTSKTQFRQLPLKTRNPGNLCELPVSRSKIEMHD